MRQTGARNVLPPVRRAGDVYRAMAAETGVRAFVSKQDTASQLPVSIRTILEQTAAGQGLVTQPRGLRS
jgi:hypothetical protein